MLVMIIMMIMMMMMMIMIVEWEQQLVLGVTRQALLKDLDKSLSLRLVESHPITEDNSGICLPVKEKAKVTGVLMKHHWMSPPAGLWEEFANMEFRVINELSWVKLNIVCLHILYALFDHSFTE
jgi:hypothetical protein